MQKPATPVIFSYILTVQMILQQRKRGRHTTLWPGTLYTHTGTGTVSAVWENPERKTSYIWLLFIFDDVYIFEYVL